MLSAKRAVSPFGTQYTRTRTNAGTAATTPLGVRSKVKRHRRNYEKLLRRGLGGQGWGGRVVIGRTEDSKWGYPIAMHEGIHNPYSITLSAKPASQALQRGPRLESLLAKWLRNGETPSPFPKLLLLGVWSCDSQCKIKLICQLLKDEACRPQSFK